ncbi:sensor histidine kinase [Sphingomonas sp. RIT328]|uniref:sensor histidine kinase n=1 Tax=Sphingomonas sp. RIT328 TaxID=1470591 RepID=UPI00044C7CFF|nr:HAMP domain-containing sensor histidine kinase [Sphingomonas sp. RIT328]EZP51122.1 Histidine kinase-, DNA gyrase B-, and HSP90-like ATPase family protein [Sphingomonas sp. RIT328]
MGSDIPRPLATALALFGCGIVAAAAWRWQLWGSVSGALLVALWLALRSLVVAPPPPRHDAPPVADPFANRLLLDAAPTPMLGIEAEQVRALNRAARAMFATDDRVLPPPPALLSRDTRYLRHAERRWRIDRVVLTARGGERIVAALVDSEQEERVAEARATGEMIHVLGHELLNGLAPIVSLADSGVAALDRPAPDLPLLREILTTLARRTEGLQRFTEAYRALARLPEPQRRAVSLTPLADDLARLFAVRWPQVRLICDAAALPDWSIDRDQISQALWALLQNAAEAALASAADPRVTLALHVDGRTLACHVGDNGGGIAAADVARIFRPFHTTKADGTGVGLSLARQIAHAHGGTLTLASAVPAHFILSIPYLDADVRVANDCANN